MIARIKNCKAYVSSSRKRKINAAMDSSVNKELVMQLKSYLSDESIDDIDKDDDINIQDDDVKVDEHKESDDKSKKSNIVKKDATNVKSDVDDSDDSVVEHEVDVTDQESNDEIDNPEDLNSATNVGNLFVDLDTAPSILGSNTDTDYDTIMSMLNNNDSTSGVDYILSRNGNELWIYYNDDVNLYDKMSQVIKMFDSSKYMFNRLARSYNAIVLDII